MKENNRNFISPPFFKELYSYKLPEFQNMGHNYEYKFPCLQKRDGNLIISGYNLYMNSDENYMHGNEVQGFTILIQAKADTQGSIDDNYNFYYFTYNNASDFSSGYSTTYLDIIQSYYASSFNKTNLNDNSPLNFIDNVEITEVKFIPGTKFVYYKIYNKDKDTTYYGLIDIKLNKVIYNIEGNDNIKFIPNSSGNMLAITDTSMYLVCMVKSSSEDSCISENDCVNLILDIEGNKCQSECDSGKIKIMPEGICINKEYCDLNIFVLNEAETECGLCNYFYPEGAKYKLINTNGCLEYIPNNSEIYGQQQWNLFKCKENYHAEDVSCKPDYCYETCETCDEISNNIDDQKCSSYKTG